MLLKSLYGENADIKQAKNRILDLQNLFFEKENSMPEFIFSSSGRAEILGNHTDHNNGIVMVASISCDCLAVVSKRDDTLVKIYSKEYGPVIVDISDTMVKNEEYGTSNALTRGVAKAIIDKGYSLKGFTAYTTSNIFKGAGVSSSAAFEVLVCEIFNTLYLNKVLTAVDRAIISQYAENVYFNKPCGLLDQSGISIGSLVKLDFENPVNPQIQQLPFPKGYTAVLTNTGGDHASLTEHYASIRSEMESVANYFGKKVLRQIPYEEFLSQIPNLKRHFSGRAILRAMHFYKENERVLLAEKSLLCGDTKTFLKCVNESGISSLTMLQNCYVPADKNQPIVLAIEYSRSIIKDGACRVHGGGFAGSILAIVSDKEVDNYVSKMKDAFGEDNVFKANIRTVGTVQVTLD